MHKGRAIVHCWHAFLSLTRRMRSCSRVHCWNLRMKCQCHTLASPPWGYKTLQEDRQNLLIARKIQHLSSQEVWPSARSWCLKFCNIHAHTHAQVHTFWNDAARIIHERNLISEPNSRAHANSLSFLKATETAHSHVKLCTWSTPSTSPKHMNAPHLKTMCQKKKTNHQNLPPIHQKLGKKIHENYQIYTVNNHVLTLFPSWTHFFSKSLPLWA